MSIDESEESETATYTIEFSQNENDDGTYENIAFKNIYPTGFTLRGDITFTDEDGQPVENATVDTTNAEYFSITGFSLEKGKTYTVKFSGTSLTPTEENPVVKNSATITYTKVSANSETAGSGETSGTSATPAENEEGVATDGAITVDEPQPEETETSTEPEEGSGTEEGSDNTGDTDTDGESEGTVSDNLDSIADNSKALLGNTINKTTSLTNTVETDVTHMYLKTVKTVSENDSAQTFLFKIERYASKKDNDPTDVYYTQVHCITPSADGSTYTGSAVLQADKRGYYKVTEITDWSATDYDFGSVAVTHDVETRYKDSNGTQTVRNDYTTTSQHSASFLLPRRIYETSGALATDYGTPSDDTEVTVSFVNKPSDYAYLSGQSYAENKIVDKKAEETEQEETEPEQEAS
jgi:hypothetical protein